MVRAPALAQILGVASAAGLRHNLRDGLGAQAAPLLAGTPVRLALPAPAPTRAHGRPGSRSLRPARACSRCTGSTTT